MLARTTILFAAAFCGLLYAQDQPKHEHAKDPEHREGEHEEDHEGVRPRLLELSLNVMTAVGTSTSTNAELRNLQLGNHDPRRRGFTLQQAELAFAGALEPYFAGHAYLVATEETVELEEAFLRSLFLPWFELKAGYFFTEFGRINVQHPHDWRWLDQPVANGRILGPEGLRGVGARAAFKAGGHRWLFAIQNGDDSTAISFAGEGHTHEGETEHEGVGGWPVTERDVRTLGDLLYCARWDADFAFGPWSLSPGLSLAYGPNTSGEAGKTWLWGGDMALEWRDDECFFRAEGEYMQRYWQAGAAVVENDPVDPNDDEFLDATVLSDWGVWLELTGSPGYGLVLGLRLEVAGGFRSGHEQRDEDPLRDDRYRIAPMASWQPLEQLKVTLQYNFDHAEHLGGNTSHGIWLGIRVMFGVHGHDH